MIEEPHLNPFPEGEEVSICGAPGEEAAKRQVTPIRGI